MESESRDSPLTDRERADLAALADDALPARRRAAVEARLEADPQMRARVDEQRRVGESIRAASLEVSAPTALRTRLEAARREAAPRARRRRFVLGGAFAAVAAAVALALVLTLPGDVPGGPTLVQAAELAVRPPTMAAPTPDRRNPKLLRTSVEGVAYPYWDDIKWEVSGTRTDNLDGRRVTTVFYDRDGKRVGYQIIPGDRVAPPVATKQQTINGTVFRTFKVRDLSVVTWVRGDHTCVLTGRGVSTQVLYKLASWRGGGAVPF